jgi:methyl-accepting chemotaxis protein
MQFTKLRIGYRLGLSFGLIAALLAVITALTYVRIGTLSADIDATNHYLYPKTVLANRVKDKVTEAVISMRNALLDPAKAAAELDSIETGAKVIVASIDKLEHSAASERDREFIATLKQIRANFVAARTRFAALVKDGKAEEAQAWLFSTVNPAQQAYYGVLDQLIAHEDGLMQAAGQASAAAAASTRRLVLLLAALALLVSAAVAWYATRTITAPLAYAVGIARRVADGDLTSTIVVDSGDETGQLLQSLRAMNGNLLRIVTRVRDGTGRIAGVSDEIAAGNLDLSARTETQASALERTAAAIEQLTAAVRNNADSAEQANTNAAQATRIARLGGEAVADVVQTMTSINQSARKIVDIISVIDGIAFQTNILALNAAVEAARAGEQGRGFAVVAGEVRNLAQRSAAAAREIKTLIEDSLRRVEAGSLQVAHAGGTMNDVVESVQRVAGIIAAISDASREQSEGIAQVNQAVLQMDQVTQKNAALVEEAGVASGQLQQHAGVLADVVSTFKLTLAQSAPAARPAAAPRRLAAV